MTTSIEEALRSGAVLAGVKPLEWEQAALQSRYGDRLVICMADCVFGTYAVEKESEIDFVVTLAGLTTADRQGYRSRDAAKAAAQADYSARIRSALSPDPDLVALIEERDRLKVERDDLVSRAEVLRVLRRLGDQDADLALYGAEDNARAREYGEAAMTRACCAVSIMPPPPATESADAKPQTWQGLDGRRLQLAINAFYEPCEGTTIDGVRAAILAWEQSR